MREPPETACVRASGAPGGPEARVAALLLHSGRSDAQPCVGALVHAPAAVRRMTRPSCQGLTPREVALLGPYAELHDVNAQFNDSLTTMSPAQVLASTIYLVDHHIHLVQGGAPKARTIFNRIAMRMGAWEQDQVAKVASQVLACEGALKRANLDAAERLRGVVGFMGSTLRSIRGAASPAPSLRPDYRALGVASPEAGPVRCEIPIFS